QQPTIRRFLYRLRARGVRPLLATRYMPCLAQIRSLLLCIRVVASAAGFACVSFCDSRSRDALRVDLTSDRCSGHVLNREVQRALRRTRHMSFDSSLSAVAEIFAADALETLALGRNPR